MSDKIISDERVAHMHGVAEYMYVHAKRPFPGIYTVLPECKVPSSFREKLTDV